MVSQNKLMELTVLEFISTDNTNVLKKNTEIQAQGARDQQEGCCLAQKILINLGDNLTSLTDPINNINDKKIKIEVNSTSLSNQCKKYLYILSY